MGVMLPPVAGMLPPVRGMGGSSMRAGAMGGMLPPVGGITYIFQGQGYKTIMFHFLSYSTKQATPSDHHELKG